MEKNVLLTSLSSQGDRKSHHYFSYEDETGFRYCDGLSVAEAGTKYLLSVVPMDEIIVLGEGMTYKPGEENKRTVLREYSDFAAEGTENLSEYSFFQYRISQFLDGLDLEGIDVLEDIALPRKTSIINQYQAFCQTLSRENGFRPDRVFHMISQDENLYLALRKAIPDLSQKESLWLQRYMYTQLADSMKLVRRVDNEDIKVAFIPTGKTPNGYSEAAENVGQIVRTIKEMGSDTINLYIDMQGLDSSDGYTILGVLSMLSNDQNGTIHIKEIITSHTQQGMFSGVIDNKEMKRYDINKLVSGMSAFIRYGKVDEVQAYWDSRNIQNDHVDLLLYAMRRVDEGISLCNIEDLEFGIKMLKDVFNSTPKDELEEVESNIFHILEETIRLDYGTLLDGEELDELQLVKWAMRKKFYQQSLTIVESRMTTDIVKRGFLYYAKDEETRKEFMEELNQLYWSYLPKDRWNFNDIPHFFIKYYGRSQMKRDPKSTDRQKTFTEYRIRELDNQAEDIKPAYSVLNENREVLSELLYRYYTLGDIRNKINHAEKRSLEAGKVDVHKENENIKLLKTGMESFIKACEAARKCAQEVHPDPVEIFEITGEELKEYADAHRIYPDSKFKGNRNNQNRRPRNDQKPAGENAQTGKTEDTKPEAGAKEPVKQAESLSASAGNSDAVKQAAPVKQEEPKAVIASSEKTIKSGSQILRITVNIEG